MEPLYGFLQELQDCLKAIENRLVDEKDSHTRAELRASSKTYRTIISQYRMLINQVERQGLQ